MASVFNGTLTGEGVQALSSAGVVTDVDINVTTIGPHVTQQGPVGHRRLTNVGWVQFFSTAFGGEAVTEHLWFNSESQDMEVHCTLNQPADSFAFWVNPGSAVLFNVSV